MLDSEGQLWTIAGVALEGYTSILFMLRHVVSFGTHDPEAQAVVPDITQFPLALTTSRHILETVHLLLVALPFMGTVAVTFVVYKAHIPFACLATNLLESAAPQEYEADAALLYRVTKGLRVISSSVMEFAPLTVAIEGLNTRVRDWLCDNRST